MKRPKNDLRDFFRAMPIVAAGSRESAFTAFMKSILCEGTDRDAGVLPAAGKCFAFPMLSSRLFAAPAGANLVAPVCNNRVIRTDEQLEKGDRKNCSERAVRLGVTGAL
jgi:hypothetical protein